MYKALIVSLLISNVANAEELPAVPSGLALKFQELLFPQEDQMFLGITAEELAKLDFDQADKDLELLCQDYALPIAKETGVKEIAIRLSDKVLPFGETDAEVVQFMGLYDVSQGRCEWL